MRAYVTGASGFVGTWLCACLREAGDEVHAPFVEIGDAAALRASIADVAPDAIYHLAGQAHVGSSWTEPLGTFATNATGTLHVLEAARALARRPRVLLVSSAEVYGAVRVADLPVTERHPLAPVSPYAASKAAAEFLGLQAWLGGGLEVIRTRAFNHVGVGQSDQFVVSGVARQVAEAELGHAEAVVRVGNLAARRDITDVRDVVRAYRALIVDGRPGEVYNVCSGFDIGIDDVVARLVAFARIPLEVVVDPARVRPVDIPVLRGDPSALIAATGWTPRYALDETLAGVIEYWRSLSRTTRP